jgi:hypothetical protein
VPLHRHLELDRPAAFDEGHDGRMRKLAKPIKAKKLSQILANTHIRAFAKNLEISTLSD